jgi:hypothetical protein
VVAEANSVRCTPPKSQCLRRLACRD